jgi:hypothetical protein
MTRTSLFTRSACVSFTTVYRASFEPYAARSSGFASIAGGASSPINWSIRSTVSAEICASYGS